jgi:hypothetical protein
MTLLNAARLALGAVVLLQPRRVAAWWGADPGSGATVWAVRGARARHLAQAVTSTVDPTPGTRTLSSAVDLVHAASMLGLAVVSSRLHRPYHDCRVHGLVQHRTPRISTAPWAGVRTTHHDLQEKTVAQQQIGTVVDVADPGR